MDKTDRDLIAELRRNARLSVSDLAQRLGLSRATARARIARLVENGEIVGFTVVTRADDAGLAVRGVTMIAVEGKGTEKVISTLLRMPHVQELHTTHGRWDIIVEIGAGTLAELDALLRDIRVIDGIATSETSLYLNTRRAIDPKS